MQVIDIQTAEAYLRAAGHLDEDEAVTIKTLPGGVSNCVLYVQRTTDAGADFVLKQAREQLQVEVPWFCSMERVWQEMAVLEDCRRLLAESERSSRPGRMAITIPEILFQDVENFAYAMTAAPHDHVVWKSELLQSRCDPQIAIACGDLLALLHGRSWHHEAMRKRLGNRQFFTDLRIDPYYRYLLRNHTDLTPVIESLIDSLPQQACSLVHGDYSPKNLLVYKQGLMLVDFEVGHFGDPAFDLGFFLSHLVLKAIWSVDRFREYWQLTEVFWEAYWAGMQAVLTATVQESLQQRAMSHFAACLLARLDGKSPVEYLTSEVQCSHVRHLARQLLLMPVKAWSDVELLASPS